MALWDRVPLVPVTVTEYDPVGVLEVVEIASVLVKVGFPLVGFTVAACAKGDCLSGSADEADCYGRGCPRSLDDGAACWIETYAIIEGSWRAE